MADPAVVTTVVSTDYTATITAIGTAIAVIIAAVINGIITLRTARDAREAKAEAVAAKKQSIETAKAVDGKMAELVTLVRKDAKSEGKLEEKKEQSDRKAIADTAVLQERAKVAAESPVVTPAVVADSLTEQVTKEDKK